MTDKNELVIHQMRNMAANVETPQPSLSSTLQRARRRMVRRRAIAATVLVGVAAAVAGVIVPSIDTDGSSTPVATSIQPRDMSAGPLSARSEMTAVAVDGGVFYWGGITSVTQDPGAMPGPPQTYVNDGATYDVGADSWTPAPLSPLTARAAAPAVWTGSGVLIAGGRTDATVLSDAATYDPRSQRWESLPSAPNCPSQMVRVETLVFALGGCASDNNSDASYFDLRDESWTALPNSGVGEIVGATVLDGHPVAVGDSGALAMYERDSWRALQSAPVAPGSGGFKVLPLGQRLIAVTTEATTDGDEAVVSEFYGGNWAEVGRGGAPVQDSFPDGVVRNKSILWSTFRGICTWDGLRVRCADRSEELLRAKAPIVLTGSDSVAIWGGADVSDGSPLDTGVLVDDWVN